MPLGTIQVPFPDSSMPGIRTQESGGRLVNCYLEPLGPGAPSQIVYRRAPGLGFFGTTTYGAGFRGAMLVDNLLYCAVAGSNLVTFNSAGGDFTQVGAVSGFAGTQKGFFARNNNSPADMVYVDPAGTQNLVYQLLAPSPARSRPPCRRPTASAALTASSSSPTAPDGSGPPMSIR